MKIFLLSGIFLLFSVITDAQSVRISGSVADSLTGTALYPANVVLREANSRAYLKGTITDEAGYFRFTGAFSGNYLLTVSYIGYHSKDFQVTAGDEKQISLGNILLSTAPVEIAEVEVIYKPLIQYGEDSDVTLNLDMLGDLEEQSVFDVISSLTGLYADFDEKIRYDGYSDFTVLIDGKKLGSRYTRLSGNGNMETYTLKRIPAKYIKTVEILPEPKGRYGYYTPVINLVPKGNLRDFYTVFTEGGIEDKYGGGIGISRIGKKLTVTPEVSYRHPAVFSNEDEDREYRANPENSYTRNSDTRNRTTDKKAALRAEYHFDDTQNLQFSAEGNFAENTIRTARNTFYAGGENDRVNDYRYSRSPQYRYSLDYRKRFYIGEQRHLFLNARASMDRNSEEKHQDITGLTGTGEQQQYRSDKDHNAGDAGVKLNYFNTRHRFRYSFNTGFSWSRSDEEAVRELYDQASDTWEELAAYSGDQSFSRLSSDVSFRVSRSYEIKKEGITIRHAFSANISENLAVEKIVDHLKDDKSKEKKAKTSFGFNYRGNLSSYGMLVFNYTGLLQRPTAEQLLETPVYIDDYTIRTGNAGLKSEMVNTLSVDYNWNNTDGITVSGNSVAPPRFGYAVRAMYSAFSNKIVQSYSTNDSGQLVYSYKNSQGTKMLSANSDFRIRVSTFMNIRLGAAYQYNTYNDNAGAVHSGNSWSLNTGVNVRLVKKLRAEAKYQYRSPQISYQAKSYGYHEGSVSLSGPVWKNNIDLSVEATNLLSHSGRKTVHYGDDYRYETVHYPECPVIWFRASLMLFKFMKK